MLNKGLTKQIKQVGLTLIELMIAILLATLVIAASMGFLFSSVKSSTENINTILLNQELRSTLGFIHDEVRRSGFTTDATNDGMLTLLNWNAGNSCLTFGYQRAVSTANAAMTFRLDNNGNMLFKDSDSGVACQGVAINDSQLVRITNFTVTPANISASTAHPTLGGTSVVRMTVSLTGSIDNPPITRTLSEVIRVRNEWPQ